MKKVDKIRNRKSYKRFDTLYDILEDETPSKEKLRQVFLHMNDMYAFGSRTNARYALESMNLVIVDREIG